MMIHQYLTNGTYIACVDLEATCCNDNSFPRDEMEIIEIGITVVDSKQQIVARFDSFVKPTIHTTLTDFCKELTTIEQKDVDNAETWDVVAAKVDAFLDAQMERPDALGMLWMSWGDFDRNVIARECSRWKIESPMPPVHYNLKYGDARLRNTTKERGLYKAITSSNINFPGTLHRAGDDAHAVALVLQHITPGLIRSKL